MALSLIKINDKIIGMGAQMTHNTHHGKVTIAPGDGGSGGREGCLAKKLFQNIATKILKL